MRWIPIVLLCLGILLLAQVVFPLISYKIWELTLNDTLISPYPKTTFYPGISVKNSDNFSAFISSMKRGTTTPYKQFQITIPKLGLEDVEVTVDSNDLEKGLAHLPGSALPGEKGNVFISGHSTVLFYNNFSKLPNLKEGDEIKVKIGETELQYRVQNIKVVLPNDLSVIPPPDLIGRYLSLMTCVPPGLNLKRLVVLAVLI